jgi:tetratricopeptide (TPR) repeat protein
MLQNLVLTPLLKFTVKSGLKAAKKLLEESPVQRAVTLTADQFPNLEVRSALKKWCESDEFADLFERFKRGDRSITTKSIIESFVQISDFYNDDDTQSSAQSVLITFNDQLQEQIYKSEEGLSTLANRQEELHFETREQTRTLLAQSNEEIVEQLSGKVGETFKGILATNDAAKSAEIRDKVLGARIEEARQLLREGRFRSARSRLVSIRTEAVASEASAGSQFLIAINLGLCAIQLNELEDAKRELDVALTLRPNEPEALAYAAFVAARMDDFERAGEVAGTALEKGPEHPQTTAIVFRVLCTIGKAVEVERYLGEHEELRLNPDCLLTLGQCNYELGKFSEAEDMLRQAIEKGNLSPFAHFFLGLSIFRPTRDALSTTPRLRWKIPTEILDRLKEAKSELTKAIELFGTFEDATYRHEALINRAAVKGLLNEVDGGLRDCDAILSEDESNSSALRNKGIFLSKAGRHVEAIETFERISDESEREGSLVILASSYLLADRPKDAIRLLEPQLRGKADPKEIAIAELLISAYAKIGNQQAIDRMLTELQATDPGNADVKALMAEANLREGKLDAAIELFREALAYSNNGQREIIVLQLAEVYFRQKNWAEAATLYAEIVDTTFLGNTLRNYVVSLFNSGSRNEAFRIAKELRGEGSPIPVVSEVEAAALEYIGDLEQAKELYVALSEIEPHNVFHRIRAVTIELRRNNNEEARTLLQSIPNADFKNDPSALIRIAELRAALRLGEVLPLAYRARQLGYEREDIHHAYIRLFVNRETSDNQLLVAADEVAKDTTVHLARGNDKFRFTLLEDKPIELQRGELSLQDGLAQKLLGHRKGEIVPIKDSPLEQLSYEIVEIQSKYVSAFQESMNNFTTWFPDNPALHRFEVKNEDVSAVFAQLDRHQRRVSDALSSYRQNQMPFALLAQLIGRSVLEVWSGVISDPQGRVFASSGAIPDTKSDAEILAEADSIVLDLTGLLTICHLNLTGVLPQRFKEILISQTTLDIITEEIVNSSHADAPKAIMGKVEDRYFAHEVSQAERDSWGAFLDQAKNFLMNSTKVTPVKKSLEIRPELLEQMEGVLGSSGAISILAASEQDIPLYSDDLGLRRMAAAEWQVSTFWTQSLLIDLQFRSLLTRDEYMQAIRKLVLSNYRHVTISANDLMWILRDDLANNSATFQRVIEMIQGPDCDEDSALGVAADLTRLVWLEPLLFQKKLATLDLTLSALSTGRIVRIVLAKFRAALRHRFSLLPIQLQPILQNVDLWERQLRLRKGLVSE